jgi:hypothetical protein
MNSWPLPFAWKNELGEMPLILLYTLMPRGAGRGGKTGGGGGGGVF